MRIRERLVYEIPGGLLGFSRTGMEAVLEIIEDKIEKVPNMKSTLRLPGLEPGVCSGLILSGVLTPGSKIGVGRRRTYQMLFVILYEVSLSLPDDLMPF